MEQPNEEIHYKEGKQIPELAQTQDPQVYKEITKVITNGKSDIAFDQFLDTKKMSQPIIDQKWLIENLQLKPEFQEMNLDYIDYEEDRKYVISAMNRYRSLTPFKINHVKVDCKTNLKIKSSNYFSLFAKQKLMHYFKTGTNQLLYLSVDELSDPKHFFIEKKQDMHSIEFKQNDKVFCEQLNSISDNSGRLFVTNAYGVNNTFYEVLFDRFEGGLLKPCGSKLFACQDNSLISFNNEIYSVGGRIVYNSYDSRCKINQKIIKCCEKYDFNANSWSQVPDLQFECHGAILVNYQNKYLIKLWGTGISNVLERAIEIFDPEQNRWSLLNYNVDAINPISSGIGVMIDDQNILVLGGNNQNNFNQRFSTLINVNEYPEYRNQELLNFSFRQMNKLDCPFYDKFHLNSQAIVQNGAIYLLREWDYKPLFKSQQFTKEFYIDEDIEEVQKNQREQQQKVQQTLKPYANLTKRVRYFLQSF